MRNSTAVLLLLLVLFVLLVAATGENCKTCSKGMYMKKPEKCECETCPRGFYMPRDSKKESCFRCKSCNRAASKIVLSPCNHTSNIVCGCPKGYAFVVQDDRCRLCLKGTWSPGGREQACKNHANCTALGKLHLHDGTNAKDTVCSITDVDKKTTSSVVSTTTLTTTSVQSRNATHVKSEKIVHLLEQGSVIKINPVVIIVVAVLFVVLLLSIMTCWKHKSISGFCKKFRRVGPKGMNNVKTISETCKTCIGKCEKQLLCEGCTGKRTSTCLVVHHDIQEDGFCAEGQCTNCLQSHEQYLLVGEKPGELRSLPEETFLSAAECRSQTIDNACDKSCTTPQVETVSPAISDDFTSASEGVYPEDSLDAGDCQELCTLMSMYRRPTESPDRSSINGDTTIPIKEVFSPIERQLSDNRDQVQIELSVKPVHQVSMCIGNALEYRRVPSEISESDDVVEVHASPCEVHFESDSMRFHPVPMEDDENFQTVPEEPFSQYVTPAMSH
uniref:TNFR-Cys domain-containing protein n=1 Tax=Eptatretus burgeri TaxID=7764 RepID=A0A8C4RBC0_EPTBU